MKNNSVSDFVAATMDAVLKSQEHKNLFGTQYKFASDENDASSSMCSKCHHSPCDCDTSMADDTEVDENDASDSSSSSSDEEMHSSAYDVAVDSLLTASAALDSLGLERGSALSLKLASLVVEAKKKDTSKKSDSKKSDSKKSDSNAAKDKKSDSKKNDSKKSDSKKSDSKKSDSNAAKDKKSDSKKPASSSSSKGSSKGSSSSSSSSKKK